MGEIDSAMRSTGSGMRPNTSAIAFVDDIFEERFVSAFSFRVVFHNVFYSDNFCPLSFLYAAWCRSFPPKMESSQHLLGSWRRYDFESIKHKNPLKLS